MIGKSKFGTRLLEVSCPSSLVSAQLVRCGRTCLRPGLLQMYWDRMPNLRWLHSLTVGCEKLVSVVTADKARSHVVVTNAKVRDQSLLHAAEPAASAKQGRHSAHSTTAAAAYTLLVQGIFKEMLAEWALTCMLFFSRNIPQVLHNQQAHSWTPFVSQPLRCACRL